MENCGVWVWVWDCWRERKRWIWHSGTTQRSSKISVMEAVVPSRLQFPCEWCFFSIFSVSVAFVLLSSSTSSCSTSTYYRVIPKTPVTATYRKASWKKSGSLVPLLLQVLSQSQNSSLPLVRFSGSSVLCKPRQSNPITWQSPKTVLFIRSAQKFHKTLLSRERQHPSLVCRFFAAFATFHLLPALHQAHLSMHKRFNMCKSSP